MAKKRGRPAKAGRGSLVSYQNKKGYFGEAPSDTKRSMKQRLFWGAGGLAASALLAKGLDKLTDRFLPPVEGDGFTWHQLIKPVVLSGSGALLYGIAKKKNKPGLKDAGIGFLIGAGASTVKTITKAVLKKDIMPGLFGDAVESTHYKEAKQALEKLLEDNNQPLMLEEGPANMNGFGEMPGSSFSPEELNEVL